jgi:DNA-binding NarL/FixJ family response regulator
LTFFALRRNQEFEVEDAAHNGRPVWRREAIMLTIIKETPSKFPVGFPRLVRGQAKEAVPLKVLVIDDHWLIREALRSLLKELRSGAIVIEAANGHQAVQLVTGQDNIGLVLLDLNLPDRDGFTVLSRIRSHHPMASVVVLLDNPDRATTLKALNLGALGVIPKSERRQIIFGALQLVLAGGTYIPHEILMREEPQAKPADINLTSRQLDVLALMMQGKSNKAICRVLNLAVPTVKNHITAILKGLNVSNRTEAVIAAGDLGWPIPRANGEPQTLSLATH